MTAREDVRSSACGRSYALSFLNSAPKSCHRIFAAWKRPFLIDNNVPYAEIGGMRKRTIRNANMIGGHYADEVSRENVLVDDLLYRFTGPPDTAASYT